MATVVIALLVKEIREMHLNAVDPVVGWTTETDPEGW